MYRGARSSAIVDAIARPLHAASMRTNAGLKLHMVGGNA
jgi:hypothetical protein